MSARIDWTLVQTDALCEAVGDGQTFAAIAPSLGRTRSALIGRFNRLAAETSHWTPASIDRLCELVADGVGFVEISRRMGVSQDAVAARFALVRKAMGEQAR